MKQTSKFISVIILSTMLVACGVASAVPTLVATAPVRATSSISIPPATLTPMPTLVSPTPTFPAIPLSHVPDGLRIVYVLEEDQNIYIQNAGNAPVQLTYSGDNVHPVFTDDGERLIFRHNPEDFTFGIRDLSSIHADGTQQQVLVTGTVLEPLHLGYDEFTEVLSWAPVPGTHQVLFNTWQLDEQISHDLYRAGAKPTLDLLSVDIDSGEINSLLAPGQGGKFVISPDGGMVAVQAKGHIDVVGLDGQMIRQNLVTYTPSQPYELIPDMIWTDDSREIIVALPVDTEYELRRDGCNTDVGARSIWRYAIEGHTRIQISLDPPPIGNSGEEYSVSPDGNWIFYHYYDHALCKTNETKTTPGSYLGNLFEGDAQLYSPNTDPVWSPDSKHFLYDLYEQGMFLGSVDQPPVLVDSQAVSLGWIDSNHYFAYYVVDGSAVGVVREIRGETIYFPVSVPISILEDTNRMFRFDFIYLDQ